MISTMSLTSYLRLIPSLIALASAPFILGSSCMSKPCIDATDCVRECSCEFASTNENYGCNISYQCDVATDQCEASYNELTCDDICEQYARRSLCGSQRCSADSNCARTVDCQITYDDGTTEAITCSHDSTCDSETQLCDETFSLDDASFCSFCLTENQIL